MIYSVAFPPDHMQAGRGGSWVGRCWRSLQSLFGSMGLRRAALADSHDAERGNAWGFDAYGLRLAVLNATELLQLASTTAASGS